MESKTVPAGTVFTVLVLDAEGHPLLDVLVHPCRVRFLTAAVVRSSSSCYYQLAITSIRDDREA